MPQVNLQDVFCLGEVVDVLGDRVADQAGPCHDFGAL